MGLYLENCKDLPFESGEFQLKFANSGQTLFLLILLNLSSHPQRTFWFLLYVCFLKDVSLSDISCGTLF